MKLSKLYAIVFFVFFVSGGFAQVWPINQSDDPNYWNRISATFGEIHSTEGDHLHGAVDIDVNVLNCPVRASANGRVYQVGNISVNLEHQFPSNSGSYFRRTRYLHVVSVSVAVGALVTQGDQIAAVEPSSATTADHLHFEMWQFESGNWYKVNPFGNEMGWQLGSPADATAPEVNDIFVQGSTESNNVPSGFSVYQNTGGSISNLSTHAKVHFLNRPGSTGAPFNFVNDKLTVFGNIIFTASVRDPSVNSTASAVNGVTIHKLNYQIDNDLKYSIYFDRVTQAEDNLVGEIFHTEFNSGEGRLYGNNDFIELYTTNNNFLSVDKRINNQISNGVWSTKALQGTTRVFANTPTDVASHNGNALYSDGEHSILTRAEDASGLSNEASLKVVVDNFLPFVKDVVVRKGDKYGRLVYRGNWNWSAATSQMVSNFEKKDDAPPLGKLWIKITMSEPMKEVRVNIPSNDGPTFFNAVPVSIDGMEFVAEYSSLAGTGEQTINISGIDQAGNSILVNPTNVPARQPNGTWPSVSQGVDSNHKINIGLLLCGGGFSNGRTAASSSGCIYSDFTSNQVSVGTGFPVVFTPITSGTGTISHTWNFGAGASPATSTSSGPQTVVYSTTGAKTVSLKICDATNNCVTEEKVAVVTVMGTGVSQLAVDFSATPLAVNTGQTIQLTSTVTGSVGTVSYSWHFDSGVSQGSHTSASPLISYETPGNKTISLTVTDANGSVTKVRNSYLAITQPTFNVLPVIQGCITTGNDGAITLTQSVSGGNGPPYDIYKWDFGDGTISTSTAGLVPHTYAKGGTYTVRLTVCDETSCGTAIALNCVTVPSSVGAGAILPNFLIENVSIGPTYFPLEVGLNTPVTFTDATTGGSNPSNFTYSWDFESHYYNSTGLESAVPATATTRGPHEVYYSVSGKKEVRLNVNASGSPKTLPDVVDVKTGRGSGRCFAKIGEAAISSTCWSSANPPQFTVPIDVSNCPVAKVEVLYWDTPTSAVVLPNNRLDFAAMNVAVPQFPLTADFSFAVYQYDGVSYNRIGYRRQRFTIFGPVQVDAGVDKQMCVGSTIALGSTNKNNLSYEWTSSTAANLGFLSSTSQAMPTFAGSAEGTYILSLKATDVTSGCVSPSDNISITVGAPKVSAASFFPRIANAVTLGASVSGGFGGNTYSWSPGTNLSGTSIAGPSFSSPSQGEFNYSVTVTDQNGCQGSGVVNVNVSDAAGNVQGSPVAFSRIVVTWVDRTDNETGYRIKRSIGSDSNFTDYATVGANITSFEDTNVSQGINYFYQVETLYGNGTSKSSIGVLANTNSLSEFTRMTTPGSIVTFGDYDGDTNLEYVVVNGTSLEIYDYTTSNSFALWKTIPGVSTYYGFVQALTVDFDNDTDLDILTYNYGTNVNLIVNNGASWSVSNLGFQDPHFIAFDADTDNDVDLMGGGGSLHTNIGSNLFNVTGTVVGGLLSEHGLGTMRAAADFNNAGGSELISRTSSGNMKQFSFYNGGYYETATLSAVECCILGDFDSGDFDKDGKLDLLVTVWGVSQDGTHIFKNNGGGNFQKLTTNLKVADQSRSRFCDYDSDGDLDYFVSGNRSLYDFANPLSSVMKNDNGTWTPGFSLEQNTLRETFQQWVDVDNDGDQDIVTYGSNESSIYLNNRGTNRYSVNTIPKPPRNLCTFLDGNILTMNWSASTDAETPSPGLTYNLYVKQNGNVILSPMANFNSANRKIVGRGNVDHNLSWTITLPEEGGQIEWGIQAIDNQYLASPFTKSTSVFFGEPPILSVPQICGTYTGFESYFSPSITTPVNCGAGVTVVGGAMLSLAANSSIVLKPGFYANNGSTFTAKIISGGGTSPCGPVSSGRIEMDDIEQSRGRDKAIDVVLFPNPTRDLVDVTIKFNQPVKAVTIQILSLTGVEIKRRNYVDALEVVDEFDLTGLAPGLYIVRVFSDSGLSVQKIVKI